MLQRNKPTEAEPYFMLQRSKPSKAGPYFMLQPPKPSEAGRISCCSRRSLQKLGGSLVAAAEAFGSWTLLHVVAAEAFRSWADLMLLRKMSKEAGPYLML